MGRGKPTNHVQKEGQEGEFQARKEIVKAQRPGMGTPCQEARSCQAKIPGVAFQRTATMPPRRVAWPRQITFQRN